MANMPRYLRTCVLATVLGAATPALAAPIERRLHTDAVDASSFLWNDWNKFVENYHPNYVADDDPKTAWVEGGKGSGAGEQLRIHLTPLDKTTRIRLRVRNGYQKSRALFTANARAKDVTVRLLPSKVEVQATLADKDGWQELAIAQPAGLVRGVELDVRSVYEGTTYADLCISDVQVFATSETPENPAFEKLKRTALLAWRATRIATARAFATRKLALPLYTAYAVTERDLPGDAGGFDHDRPFEGMLAAAANEPGFAAWTDAIATGRAVASNLGAMTRARLAPRNRTRLVEVDGLTIPSLDAIAGSDGYYDSGSIRLPMRGDVASLFADQLRVLDVKDTLAIADYETTRACRADTIWVARARSKEGPAAVQAIAVGRCGKIELRDGRHLVHTLELYVYDRAGRLSLVVGHGHLEAYRWGTEAGKPMIVGGRSLLPWQAKVVDATRREPVAAR